MEKQFIPYEQALKLKELGFDEECIWLIDSQEMGFMNAETYRGTGFVKNSDAKRWKLHESTCTSPLWQQAFDWFREVYKLDSFCRAIDGAGNSYWKISKLYKDGNIKGYSGFSDKIEKGRLECLNKLIELSEIKR